jgi:hypothetical protein
MTSYSIHDAASNVDDPIAANPEDASFLEQFRPAPLSWLVAWLFRPRHESVPPNESEQPEEHISGLA